MLWFHPQLAKEIRKNVSVSSNVYRQSEFRNGMLHRQTDNSNNPTNLVGIQNFGVLKIYDVQYNHTYNREAESTQFTTANKHSSQETRI